MEIPTGIMTMAGLIALPILPRLVIGFGNAPGKTANGAFTVSTKPKSETFESQQSDHNRVVEIRSAFRYLRIK
jgi:hypothetical protein